MSQNQLIGVYALQGIPEMAAAFKFSEDFKFDFYYSYGATDRQAKGRYTLNGDTLKLISDKLPGNDFEILSQKKQGSGYHLVFKNKNPHLLRNIKCMSLQGTRYSEYFSDDEGKIIILENNQDKLYVFHELFPDIPTLIKDENNNNNYFELALNTSLSEVSFKGIDLLLKENVLSMLPNYFMMFEDIRFAKVD